MSPQDGEDGARPDLAAIREAADRIRPHALRTPVLPGRSLDAELGGRLFFKCENLQRVGAFKARGALNAVFSLDEGAATRGVATHSSGNHGAALAFAAGLRGIPSWVVVPENAPGPKRDAVARYGATVVSCRPGLRNREEGLQRVLEETGAERVHPYDDWRVITGQGTAALELMEERPGLDLLMAPVGGGGLISGCAIAARGLEPGIRLIACEPAGADDARRSFESGERIELDAPETLADGLRASLGVRNFRVIRELVDEVATVSEEAIVAAMRLVWERLKIVIEPSSAVPVAALLEGSVRLEGRSAGIILTGGNVDLDALPWAAR